MWFVRASPSFIQSDNPSKEVITFPLVPVQQVLCNCVPLPLLHLGTVYGVPNVLQFCGSQECRAECGAWFCGICVPQQLTPVKSIDVRHPAKKQGAHMCGCQNGVVLNDGCPEWNPSLHRTISPIMPLCDVAKQYHHMLLAVLENRFVHYDLVQLQFFSRSDGLVS